MRVVVNKYMNQSIDRRDFINLAILLAVALGVGIYLISTTVLISKDGVLYIELAQQMATSPMGVIKNHPFGYPFLIFITHKIVTLFSNSSSLCTWIHSAQSINLFCRVLALVPLYFIGKLLVGSYHSFWGLLILVFLPYPAKFGSDALRDWPNILFLSCGFLIILWAVKERKWKCFFGVGLLSGLGYLIRPVCAQLVFYSLLWLGYCFFRPSETLSRRKTAAAVILVLLGFLISVGPDMKIKGAIVPPVLRGVVSRVDFEKYPVQDERQNLFYEGSSDVCTADSSGRFVKSFYEIFKNLGENLLWIFIVPWFVGVFCYFRFSQTGINKYMMAAFISVNIIVVILRSTGIEGDVSKRYVLPLICFTSFYIPMGLALLICLITKEGQSNIDFIPEKRTWLYVLIVIGLGICTPKLFRPAGSDKESYRNVAGWLNQNMPENAAIAVTDKRISFYAERRGLVYDKGIPKQARYVVKIFGGDKDPIEDEIPGAKNVFSVKGNGKKSNIVVYDFGNNISESVTFVSYSCERIADEKYRFSFVFEVKDGFGEDLAIYFHGSVKDGNVALLPVNRRKSKFANWDFYPEPPTSIWSNNNYVTVSREISAKPIPYNFNLGFYSVDTGLHGRGINLGWIDLGDVRLSSVGE